jgi:hypothetical protein
MQALTFDAATAVARVYMESDIPFFVWGTPGTGKSAMVKALARAASYRVIDIRLSLFDPTDLRGLAAIIDGQTVWLKPEFWPTIAGEKVIIFFDEMDRAPAAVKNAALQIVLDRRIGEHVLPDSVRICAAGNGASDKGFAASMGTALNNRFAHMAMEPDLESWASFADRENLAPAVVAFLRMRGRENARIFHETEPTRDALAFPTARNWERVCKIVDTCPADILLPAISGIVGAAVAGEFVAFLGMFSQVGNLADYIANPLGAPIHSDISLNFAVACALGRAATLGNVDNIRAYAARMPRSFYALTMESAVKRDAGLKNSNGYIAYATDMRTQAAHAGGF